MNLPCFVMLASLLTRRIAFTAVHKYNQLMKDFPLNELLAATDLIKVKDSVVLIFGHLNKKLKLSFVLISTPKSAHQYLPDAPTRSP